MKRQIIRIDEEKCTGCGQCIPGCPEGALQIIDGKARLISDLFCDGLGACIGTCPVDAITVEEREAEPYDERKVMENIIKQGANVIRAHLLHLKEHNETTLLKTAIDLLQERGLEVPDLSSVKGHPAQERQHHGDQKLHHHDHHYQEHHSNHHENHDHHANHRENQGHHHEHNHHHDRHHEHGDGGHRPGCPGAAMRDLRSKNKTEPGDSVALPQNEGRVKMTSQLSQWPVQLQLLNPHAPYFQDADILVCADCVPFAYADFHQRFLKGKILVTFCPKLDKTLEQYLEKLTVMFRDNNIQSISVLHMEVPCCSGTLHLVQEALKRAQKVIPLRDYTISITGDII